MKKYYIENMPQVNESMERVHAWYNGEKTDRAPVRFSEHNGRHNVDLSAEIAKFPTIKDYWFDAEYQLNAFLRSIEGSKIYGDTFPVYYPNLGPSVYASYFGIQLKYADVTSWAEHPYDSVEDIDIDKLSVDRECENWKKIEEMTEGALKKADGKFFVGYTDLHPSLDCAMDFLGTENLCYELCDNPELVKKLTWKLCDCFFPVFDFYKKKLKDMPSCTWMGIPFEGTMHIPSCDFSSMLSDRMFEEFALPCIQKEVSAFDYNIFHLDGPGVAKHIDSILDIDGIGAVQVVQGVGDDEPIMQWLPLIKKIVDRGKGVVVSLKKEELREFMSNIGHKGIYLTLAAEAGEMPGIMKMIEEWD